MHVSIHFSIAQITQEIFLNCIVLKQAQVKRTITCLQLHDKESVILHFLLLHSIALYYNSPNYQLIFIIVIFRFTSSIDTS